MARVWHLTRARLAMARRGGLPLSTLWMQASLACVFALLVRDLLPAFPYTLVGLTLGLFAVGIPLFSDLLGTLRGDEGQEWLAAQPARASEVALARALVVLFALTALALAWFGPWSILAPEGVSPLARAELLVFGWLLVIAAAVGAIAIQEGLVTRLSSAMAVLGTAWMGLVVVGLLEVLGHMPEIARLTPEDPRWAAWPPFWLARAWSAGRVGPALFGLAGCFAILRWLPSRRPGLRGARASLNGYAPLRWLALRLWVRPEERGTFDLVFLGLPREREFTLRTYPLLGIPLAFLWVSARRSPDEVAWRADLLSLLLFTSSLGLPLLLTHVPLSETPQAAWLQRLAPCPHGARMGGAIKALFVRWILPLYLALLVLGLALEQGALVGRLWPMALLLTLVVLRFLYPRIVRDLPLSRAADELEARVDWNGLMLGLASLLTVVAVVASRWESTWGCWSAAAVLGGVEAGYARRQRRLEAQV